MVTAVSKTIPFISLFIGGGLALLALLGFGEQSDNALEALKTLLPILVPTSVGGIAVKYIQESQDTKKRLLEGGNAAVVSDIVKAEIERAKAKGDLP